MTSISFPRLALGAVLGLVVAVRAMTWLAAADREAAARMAGEQRSIVTLSALADLVSATHSAGGDVQDAARRFSADHEDVVWARVVEIQNRQLLASTEDTDLAAGPLPRLLERRDPDQKAWYALASGLRSAVQANHNAGRSVREEIVVERLDDGRLSLAAPMGYGGHVLGAVVMSARGAPVDLDGGALPWLAAAAGLAVLAAVGWPLREKGRRLAAAAGVILIATLGASSLAALDGLSAAHRAAEEKVAARLVSDLERTKAFGKVAESLQPQLWDADRFRRPRKIVSTDGSVDADRIRAAFAETRAALRNQFLLIGLLGFGFAAIVGLSGAAKPT